MARQPYSTRVDPCPLSRNCFTSNLVVSIIRNNIFFLYKLLARPLGPADYGGRKRDEEKQKELRERERERGKQSGCCTRVCQCLPVSTPTYLCKSFNLTPPYRVIPEREIVSRNLFVFIARPNGGSQSRSAEQPYDRVFPMLPPFITVFSNCFLELPYAFVIFE